MMPTPNLTSNVRKQILGAGVGMVVALSLYAIGTWGPVQSLVSSLLPAQATARFSDEDRIQRRHDIAERARALIEAELYQNEQNESR